MASLQPVLETLGYTTPEQQKHLVRLLHFVGAFDGIDAKLREKPLLSDQEAESILTDTKRFPSEQEAHVWLKDATQKYFLQQVDYLNTKDSERVKKYHEELVNSLDELGVISERLPSYGQYDHGLVLGALETTVGIEIQSMLEMHEKFGVRFNNVALLGSNRPLLPTNERESVVALVARAMAKPADNNSGGNSDTKKEEERVSKIVDDVLKMQEIVSMTDAYNKNLKAVDEIIKRLDHPAVSFETWPTEIQMMQYVWEKKLPTMPPALQEMEPLRIEALHLDKTTGKRVDKNSKAVLEGIVSGKIARANTEDTISAWKNHPEVQGGTVLAISNQPYVVHQHGQLLGSLPEQHFPVIETYGKSANRQKVRVVDGLSSIAKHIFATFALTQEKIKMKNENVTLPKEDFQALIATAQKGVDFTERLGVVASSLSRLQRMFYSMGMALAGQQQDTMKVLDVDEKARKGEDVSKMPDIDAMKKQGITFPLKDEQRYAALGTMGVLSSVNQTFSNFFGMLLGVSKVVDAPLPKAAAEGVKNIPSASEALAKSENPVMLAKNVVRASQNAQEALLPPAPAAIAKMAEASEANRSHVDKVTEKPAVGKSPAMANK